VTVGVSEFGIARADGDFCSMEHAAEWLAQGPVLKAYKRQWGGAASPSKLYGSSVLLGVLFVLLCIVVGFVALVRMLI
jgi:hypothetical protein